MHASAPVVLGLFAHPDDETFGPGGTLARLGTEGVVQHLICATRGEAGTIGESANMGRERLARVRTEELQEACLALRIEPPTFLDLPDGGLQDLPEDALLLPFVRGIRHVRPHIVITFERQGISGHPDHRTVTRRSLTAFDKAADPSFHPELGPPHETARVWTYTLPASRAARVTFRTLHSTPDDLIDAFIDVSASFDRRWAAIEAHASQKPFIDRMEQELGDLGEFWNPEAFVLARHRGDAPARPADDLLAGIG